MYSFYSTNDNFLVTLFFCSVHNDSFIIEYNFIIIYSPFKINVILY